MRNWQIPKSEPQTVAVLLFPRFSNHCLANAVEPLRAANELMRNDVYSWQFATLDGRAIRSSSDLPIMADCALSAHPGGDFLFVLTSYDGKELASYENARALKAAAARFRMVVGMDTASWLMARAGLLDDRMATIHRDEITAFSEAFPSVDVVSERFVLQDDLATCGGAMTAFDLVLELIRRSHGEALRLEVAAFFMHQTPDVLPGPHLRPRGSELVERCVAIMSANLETPIAVGMLANNLGTDQRTLTRAFHAALGAPPKTVYKRLRLTSARRYAEQSDYPVAEIALRCGYRNASAMTRAFVEEFGAPPSSFRR